MKNKMSKKSVKRRYFQILFFSIIFTFHFLQYVFPATQENRKVSVAIPDGRVIQAKVADTTGLRSRGLMGKSQLKPNEGMLFIFDAADLHMMWMKNMAISIDMIWLNENKEIIAITPALPPCQIDPCPIYGPSTPSRYVLEISAGGSLSFHLREGIKLKFP